MNILTVICLLVVWYYLILSMKKNKMNKNISKKCLTSNQTF